MAADCVGECLALQRMATQAEVQHVPVLTSEKVIRNGNFCGLHAARVAGRSVLARDQHLGHDLRVALNERDCRLAVGRCHEGDRCAVQNNKLADDVEREDQVPGFSRK